jgi:hypothetical protein
MSFPFAEHGLVNHVAMEHLESDDTIRIVFVNDPSLHGEKSGV